MRSWWIEIVKWKDAGDKNCSTFSRETTKMKLFWKPKKYVRYMITLSTIYQHGIRLLAIILLKHLIFSKNGDCSGLLLRYLFRWLYC